MRGASGGFLFSIPLLYTMESWWVGTVAAPPGMAVALLAACVLVFLLTLTGGFRKERAGRLDETLIETVQAVGLSLLLSSFILVLLRRITLATPLDEALGTIIFEALPFAVGVALGNELLSGERDAQSAKPEPQGPQQEAEQLTPASPQGIGGATFADLSASTIGAAFIAFSIAPTEEVPMLAAALTPPWLLGLIAASLAISYMIVFESGFADAEKRRSQKGLLQSPLSETVASYLIALLVSVLLLLLYNQLRMDDPWSVWLSHTIVLGLPAAVGGAAGRLAV